MPIHPMLSEYSIQPFSPDKFLLMKELFLSAYGNEIDESSYHSKYNTTGLGSEVIGFIAIHTQTKSPAAFYGVFPLKLWINGREVLAAQSGDTMTHSSHQKKGLFVQLALICFEECKKKGIELIFGLPNSNSYHGFTKKLNWKHFDDIERWDLKLKIKTLPLPKLCKALKWNRSFQKFSKLILKKYKVQTPDDFSNKLYPIENRVIRNREYLNYKNDPSKYFITLNGIIFWIKLTDVMWIGDMSDYNLIDQDVLRKLKNLAFNLGYNTIIFHINRTVQTPEFLTGFKKYESEPLCYYYINNELENTKLIITGADFDTW